MTEKIKPCPYCGYEQADKLTESGKEYFVYCQCGARGSTARCGDDAILLWNAASNALEAVKAERDTLLDERNIEAARAAEMFNQREKLQEQLRINSENAEIQSFKLLAERDEARTIARRLWREKQTVDCPTCHGRGWVDDDRTNRRYARHVTECHICNGTGKVTR